MCGLDPFSRNEARNDYMLHHDNTRQAEQTTDNTRRFKATEDISQQTNSFNRYKPSQGNADQSRDVKTRSYRPMTVSNSKQYPNERKTSSSVAHDELENLNETEKTYASMRFTIKNDKYAGDKPRESLSNSMGYQAQRKQNTRAQYKGNYRESNQTSRTNTDREDNWGFKKQSQEYSEGQEGNQGPRSNQPMGLNEGLTSSRHEQPIQQRLKDNRPLTNQQFDSNEPNKGDQQPYRKSVHSRIGKPIQNEPKFADHKEHDINRPYDGNVQNRTGNLRGNPQQPPNSNRNYFAGETQPNQVASVHSRLGPNANPKFNAYANEDEDYLAIDLKNSMSFRNTNLRFNSNPRRDVVNSKHSDNKQQFESGKN
jgi:hypothetical protein